MRPSLALAAVLMAAATAATAAAPTPPPSATILLHAHPRAWRFPASAPALRGQLDPATGEWTPALAPLADPAAAATARAAARAAAVPQTRADGSSFAVVAGFSRAYEIARVAPDGRLVRECAGSEPAALRQLARPAAPAPVAEER